MLGRKKKEAEDKDTLTEGLIDKVYDVDIHLMRKPGMKHSMQLIEGNKLSIMTITGSYLSNLIDEGILTSDELDNLIDSVKKFTKEYKEKK